MPTCPYCKHEVDHLIYREVFGYSELYRTVRLNGDDLEFGEWHFEDGDFADRWYECPYCGRRLFSSDEYAKKFLKGEPIGKEGDGDGAGKG